MAPLSFLELECLSPSVSLLQLGLCKACVALKPKFREAHQVENRYFWAVTAAYTVTYSCCLLSGVAEGQLRIPPGVRIPLGSAERTLQKCKMVPRVRGAAKTFQAVLLTVPVSCQPRAEPEALRDLGLTCVLSPPSRCFWEAQVETAKWSLAVPPHLGTSWELTRLTTASQSTGRLSSVGHPSAFSPGSLITDVSIKGAL